MNIAQISRNLTARGENLLSKILTVAPLFQHAEFKPDASTHMVIPDKDTHTGSAARAEGAQGQNDLQQPSAVTRNLALYTREISIDDVRNYDSNIGVSPAGLKMFADRRVAGLAGKLADEVQADMIAGTDADNHMLGLGTFVKDAAAAGQTARLGFTADELASMLVQASMKLDTEANQNAFVELLERIIASVPGANAIITNNLLGARLSTIARRLGAAGETLNSFGQKVATFDNIPIIRVNQTAIPQTESDGTNTDCTSLYVTRFAEELGVCYSTNSGFDYVDFENVESKPQGKARLNMFLNLTVERSDALRRVSRIRL
jgi:hypothetical protein